MQSILLPSVWTGLCWFQSIEYRAGAATWPRGWVIHPASLVSRSFETHSLDSASAASSSRTSPLCRLSPTQHGGGAGGCPSLIKSPSWVQPLSHPRSDTRHVSEEPSRWLWRSDIWNSLSGGPRRYVAVTSHPCSAPSEFQTGRISGHNTTITVINTDILLHSHQNKNRPKRTKSRKKWPKKCWRGKQILILQLSLFTCLSNISSWAFVTYKDPGNG